MESSSTVTLKYRGKKEKKNPRKCVCGGRNHRTPWEECFHKQPQGSAPEFDLSFGLLKSGLRVLGLSLPLKSHVNLSQFWVLFFPSGRQVISYIF